MCAIKRSLQDAYYKQNQLACLLQVGILTALCLLGNFFFTLFNYTHSEYTLWGSCKVR